MTTRTLHLGLLLALVAVAVVVARLPSASTPPRPPHRAPAERALLSYVPANAALVVAIDVTRLRATPLGRLLAASGRELPGVGRLDAVCGFDPTTAIREVALAIPEPRLEDPSATELGVIVTGDFSAASLADCAAAVVAHRAGQPVRATLGSFTSVRDRNRPAGGEVAVRDGGPALLSGGTFLRDLVDAAEGRGDTTAVAEAHAALARQLGGEGAIVGTWVLSSLALGDAAEAGALAALRGIAVRVDFSRGLDAQVLLVCAPDRSCDGVATTVRSLRRRVARQAQEVLGLDVDDLRITEQRSTVTVELALGSDEARALIERVRARFGPLLGAP